MIEHSTAHHHLLGPVARSTKSRAGRMSWFSPRTSTSLSATFDPPEKVGKDIGRRVGDVERGDGHPVVLARSLLLFAFAGVDVAWRVEPGADVDGAAAVAVRAQDQLQLLLLRPKHPRVRHVAEV
eukprot:3613842-Rhodomonas_salina.2